MSEQRRGPGYERMRKRLGEKALEELRQRTLKEQREARARVNEGVPLRNRESYKIYPKPKGPLK